MSAADDVLRGAVQRQNVARQIDELGLAAGLAQIDKDAGGSVGEIESIDPARLEDADAGAGGGQAVDVVAGAAVELERLHTGPVHRQIVEAARADDHDVVARRADEAQQIASSRAGLEVHAAGQVEGAAEAEINGET